jgi:protein ImuA
LIYIRYFENPVFEHLPLTFSATNDWIRTKREHIGCRPMPTSVRETPSRAAFREELQRRICAVETRHWTADASGISLGIEDIDARLGASGLTAAALHEVAPANYRATPSALGFLLALSRSAFASGGISLWTLLSEDARSYGNPHASTLRLWGIDPTSVLFVRCGSSRDALWTLEEGLKSKALSLALGSRPSGMDFTMSRRLQLAAAASGTPILLLRRYDDDMPSAAVTRWRVSPAPSSQDRYGLMKNPRWRIALEHARGGRVGEWVMEWDHDALCLRLSAGMGGRAFSQNAKRATAIGG